MRKSLPLRKVRQKFNPNRRKMMRFYKPSEEESNVGNNDSKDEKVDKEDTKIVAEAAKDGKND